MPSPLFIPSFDSHDSHDSHDAHDSHDSHDSQKRLTHDIVSCQACPRLRAHCLEVAQVKRKAYRDDNYWGKPVPDFGDPKAKFVIVGLAPAAHGANRTGRMFTGDQSGLWLYRALHRAGFANQAESESADDGLKLSHCLITAVTHCAPPANKPLPAEIAACQRFLRRTLMIHRPTVILALGGIAWNVVIDEMKRTGQWKDKRPIFSHGAEVKLENGHILLGSYHPSQQNTFTGRLTEDMFDSVFARAKSRLARS